MTENKLKRLAINLSETMNNVLTPSDAYTHIRELIKRQPEYFKDYMGPDNVLKLIFYIWSYKKTSSFELAEKIFENLQFSITFDTDGEEVLETCDDCGGDARRECDDCYGRGETDCGECDANGRLECTECGGEGKIEDDEGNIIDCEECDGSGQVDCDECGGSGNIECDECDGRGSFDCEECDGSGEIETGKFTCVRTHLATWDPNINNVISDSLIDDNSFDYDLLGDSSKPRLILDDFSEDEKVKNWVESDVYYTLYVTKTPRLIFNGNVLNIDSNKARSRYQKFVR